MSSTPQTTPGPADPPAERRHRRPWLRLIACGLLGVVVLLAAGGYVVTRPAQLSALAGSLIQR